MKEGKIFKRREDANDDGMLKFRGTRNSDRPPPTQKKR